jgi:hypothetical protein
MSYLIGLSDAKVGKNILTTKFFVRFFTLCSKKSVMT